MFIGPITGNSYSNQAEMEATEGLALQRARAVTETNPLDNMSADDIEAAFSKLVAAKADNGTSNLRDFAAKQFIANHPEFVPNDRNASQIHTLLELTGATGTRVEEFEEVYQEARARGLVDIQDVEEAQPRHRASNGQFKSSLPEISEAEAYALPYEELERRAYQHELEQATQRIQPPLRRQDVRQATSGVRVVGERKASGISSRGNAREATARATGMTEEDLYNMSYDQLERGAQG